MIVAHLDLDAFFAAVEELENPELRRLPLIVGGDPHGRGVVSTANYVARRYGIGSAMSCAEALRLLPGIGTRGDEKLQAAGIETIGDLAALQDDDPLLRGKVGSMLHDRARGIDPRRLELSTERISISQEETFPHDAGATEKLH